MSSSSKSFWSTIPGLITGIAGILTAVVGLGTLLIQIGVIGGDGNGNGDSPAPGAATTRAGGGEADGGSGSTRPAFTVAPDRLRLTSGDDSGTVTVTNTGDTAFAVGSEISGGGRDQFTLRRETCGSQVPARGSCTMRVEYKGGLAANAELTVTVRNASPSQQTVRLEGSLL